MFLCIPRVFFLAKDQALNGTIHSRVSYMFACQFNRKSKQDLLCFYPEKQNCVLVRFHYNDGGFRSILVLEYIGSKAKADRTRQCWSAFCRTSNVSAIQGYISSLPCLEGDRGILNCLVVFFLKSLNRKCYCNLRQGECNLWLFCIVGFVVFVFKPTCDSLRLTLFQILLIAVLDILEVLSFHYYSYMLISEFANVHLHFLSFLACGRKLWKETVCTNSMVLLSGVLLIPTDC